MATFNNVNDYTYTRLFRDFVNFAQERVNEGKEEAIAILKGQQSLGGRKMIAVTRSLTDEVHKWTRTTEEEGDNEATRTFFRQAIANMFGGGKTISGTLSAREWRLEELAPCVAREKSCSGCFPKNL